MLFQNQTHEFLRALSRILCAAQGTNNRQAVRTGPQHISGIAMVDTANGNQWQRGGSAHLAQSVQSPGIFGIGLGSSREQTTNPTNKGIKMSQADRVISDLQSKLMTSGYFTSEKALIEVAKQALAKLAPNKVQELFNVDVPYEIAIRDFVSANR